MAKLLPEVTVLFVYCNNTKLNLQALQGEG